MNFAINAIYLEGNRTGIGRYLKNILIQWAKDHPDNKYYLYFRKDIPTDDFLQAPCFIKKVVKAPGIFKKWILWENLFLPWALYKDRKNIDWYYSPSYTIPLIQPIKKVAVAIFDIYYTVKPEWIPLKNRFTQSWLSRRAARKADLVICASDFDKNDIVKYYEVPEDKVKVVYLAAELKFQPAEKNPQNPIFFKYKIKPRYILCLGHIINRRVQHKIIEAFGHIQREHSDVSLVLVGQNRTCPFIDIQKLVDDNDKNNSIVWIHYVDEADIMDLFQQAETFIYLTIYEGESIPLREAMASGIPTITTPMLSEVTANAAIYVKDAKNSQEISQAMKKILTASHEIKEKYINAGLNQTEKYTWDGCARDTYDLFKNYEIQ